MLKGLRKKASVLSLGAISADETHTSSTGNFEKVLKQVRDFELALQAMDYLLDDRTEEGTNLLLQESKIALEQPTGIFPLALGVMGFIEATLGFEPEVMEKALANLVEAESASLNNAKYNVKHKLATSHIYPPGTEFQVTYAESTLLCALLMLLKENNGMVEGAKALFKLRTAYKTLDQIYKKIIESEPVFNRNLMRLKQESLTNMGNLSNSDLPGFVVPSAESSSSSLPADLKLMKNLEKVHQMRKSRIEGTNLNDSTDLFSGMSSCSADSPPSNTSSTQASCVLTSVESARATTPVPQNKSFRKDTAIEDSEEDVSKNEEFSDAAGSQMDVPGFEANVESSMLSSAMSSIHSSTNSSNSDHHLHVSTIDEFVHSGVQLCFGILQVVLSLIPPAIGKVLSIVGFKGDREVGLKILWKTAITSRNIHGNLALLCLLVFYDGPVQFVDSGFQLPHNNDANIKDIISLDGKVTITDEELKKIMMNPGLYTPQILKKARKCFPHNALWLLQEGRILAAQGNLYEAVDLMQSFTDNPNNKIRMQQIEALLVYDRAMFYAFKHDFDSAARDFIHLIDINSWSKGVYLFMAASCYLEKYRMIEMDLIEVDNKQQELEKYEKLAIKYFELAPTYVPGHGHNAKKKKGGIGGGSKKMPFDKFLLRKMEHIEARQKQYPDLKFIDCIGTSFIHELVYFWNGYNRMQPTELEICLKLLGYSGAKGTAFSANNGEVNYAKFPETMDEAMIRYFLQGITLRLLGKISEGLDLIDKHVISKFVVAEEPQFKFTKMTYSPYLYPTSLYEKTMFIWLLKSADGKDCASAVAESKSWLKKAELVGEGDYELSNRTGMRIKAAGDRLDQLGTMV
jgi:tetratricopeptide (TPR) repeat protein